MKALLTTSTLILLLEIHLKYRPKLEVEQKASQQHNPGPRDTVTQNKLKSYLNNLIILEEGCLFS